MTTKSFVKILLIIASLFLVFEAGTFAAEMINSGTKEYYIGVIALLIVIYIEYRFVKWIFKAKKV